MSCGVCRHSVIIIVAYLQSTGHTIVLLYSFFINIQRCAVLLYIFCNINLEESISVGQKISVLNLYICVCKQRAELQELKNKKTLQYKTLLIKSLIVQFLSVKIQRIYGTIFLFLIKKQRIISLPVKICFSSFFFFPATFFVRPTKALPILYITISQLLLLMDFTTNLNLSMIF